MHHFARTCPVGKQCFIESCTPVKQNHVMSCDENALYMNGGIQPCNAWGEDLLQVCLVSKCTLYCTLIIDPWYPLYRAYHCCWSKHCSLLVMVIYRKHITHYRGQRTLMTAANNTGRVLQNNYYRLLLSGHGEGALHVHRCPYFAIQDPSIKLTNQIVHF